jgi:hypothetical protein
MAACYWSREGDSMRSVFVQAAKLVFALVLLAGVAQAKLIRIDVKETSPVLDGKAFGASGAYERVVGQAYFAIDPNNAANTGIVDMALAPRDKDGWVEFSANIYMLRPVDPHKGNGTVFYEVSNRGNKSILGDFDHTKNSLDPRTADDFGDGYLLSQGYTVLWVGWQSDVEPAPNRMRLEAPVIQGVTGLIRAEFSVNAKTNTQGLATPGHVPYPAANPDDPNMKLMVRDQVEGPRTEVPRSSWHIENGANVVLTTGFEPGRLYELVYTAQNPRLSGVSFAGVRDVISWLKYGGDVQGIAAPAVHLQRAYGFGASQSGRFLRTLLYDGFNRDEQDRMTFDGLMVHIAGGGRGSFNERFATQWMPANPVSGTLNTVDIFPFTDLEETDPSNGMQDGILTHALPKKFWPKIFYSHAETEYYNRAAALIHITMDGSKDAVIPPNSRIYFFSGGQHGPSPFPPPAPRGTRNVTNFNPYPWLLRSLLANLDGWVKEGKAPPASVYPRIAKRELVPESQVNFPKIPGVVFPSTLHLSYPSDFGPDYRTKGVLTQLPPAIGKPNPMPVPQVDADGNDIAGIKTPEIQVPLATYTGWNLRTAEIGGSTMLYDIAGSFIPFPLTKADRLKTGDPRLSIEERYASKQDYLTKYERAANSLVQERFMLPQDVPNFLKQGAAEWDYIHSDAAPKAPSGHEGSGQ